MRNRLLISFLIHSLLGVMFVFPVTSAQSFTKNSEIIESLGFYGKDGERGNRSPKKKVNPSFSDFGDHNTPYNDSPFVYYITNLICEPDPTSEFSLKYSQQIVDISFLKSLRSVVMLC